MTQEVETAFQERFHPFAFCVDTGFVRGCRDALSGGGHEVPVALAGMVCSCPRGGQGGRHVACDACGAIFNLMATRRTASDKATADALQRTGAVDALRAFGDARMPMYGGPGARQSAPAPIVAIENFVAAVAVMAVRGCCTQEWVPGVASLDSVGIMEAGLGGGFDSHGRPFAALAPIIAACEALAPTVSAVAGAWSALGLLGASVGPDGVPACTWNMGLMLLRVATDVLQEYSLAKHPCSVEAVGYVRGHGPAEVPAPGGAHGGVHPLHFHRHLAGLYFDSRFIPLSGCPSPLTLQDAKALCHGVLAAQFSGTMVDPVGGTRAAFEGCMRFGRGPGLTDTAREGPPSREEEPPSREEEPGACPVGCEDAAAFMLALTLSA